MQLRKYQNSDRDAVIELWKEAFPNEAPHNAPSKVIDAKLASDDLIFVATTGNELLGACVAGYDGHRGWLYMVAVKETHRKGGIGARLVRQATNELKKLGCIKVNLQIRSSNVAVIDFYKSLGFEVEDRVSMGAFLIQDD